MKTQSAFAHRPLGLILLELGLVDDAQLQAALRYKDEHGIKLGQALTTLQMVDEKDLSGALREQGRLPCIHLTPGIVDAAVANELGEETSRGLFAIALHRIAGVTSVAMSDPGDVYGVDAIALRLGTPVFPIYAEAERIVECLDHVFGRASEPIPSGECNEVAEGCTDEEGEGRLQQLLAGMFAEARGNRWTRLAFEVHGPRVVVRALGTTGWIHRVDLPEPWGARVTQGLDDLVRDPAAGGGASSVQGLTRYELQLGGEAHGDRVEAWRCAGSAGPEWQFCLPPRDDENTEEWTAGPSARLEEWLADPALVLWAQPANEEDEGLLRLAESWCREGHKVAYVGYAPRSDQGGLLHLVPEPQDGPNAHLYALTRLRPDRVVIDTGGAPPEARLLRALVRAGARVVLRVEESSARAAWSEVEHDRLVTELLRGVVGRRFVPRLCQACRCPGENDDSGFTAEGCASCGDTGVGAFDRALELFRPPGPGEEEGVHEWRIQHRLQDLFEQGEISSATFRSLSDVEPTR